MRVISSAHNPFLLLNLRKFQVHIASLLLYSNNTVTSSPVMYFLESAALKVVLSGKNKCSYKDSSNKNM